MYPKPKFHLFTATTMLLTRILEEAPILALPVSSRIPAREEVEQLNELVIWLMSMLTGVLKPEKIDPKGYTATVAPLLLEKGLKGWGAGYYKPWQLNGHQGPQFARYQAGGLDGLESKILVGYTRECRVPPKPGPCPRCHDLGMGTTGCPICRIPSRPLMKREREPFYFVANGQKNSEIYREFRRFQEEGLPVRFGDPCGENAGPDDKGIYVRAGIPRHPMRKPKIEKPKVDKKLQKKLKGAHLSTTDMVMILMAEEAR